MVWARSILCRRARLPRDDWASHCSASDVLFGAPRGISRSGILYGLEKNQGNSRFVLALVFATLQGFVAALGGDAMYQLLFLIEHVGIVLAGLTKSHKLSTLWGAAGVTATILYILRGFRRSCTS